MKKYSIELDENISHLFDSLLAEAKCSASQAVSNLLIRLMGEAAAMLEFYGDSERGVTALTLYDDDGRLLSHDELFERAKLVRQTQLQEIDRLRRICDAATFQGMRPAGEA